MPGGERGGAMSPSVFLLGGFGRGADGGGDTGPEWMIFSIEARCRSFRKFGRRDFTSSGRCNGDAIDHRLALRTFGGSWSTVVNEADRCFAAIDTVHLSELLLRVATVALFFDSGMGLNSPLVVLVLDILLGAGGKAPNLCAGDTALEGEVTFCMLPLGNGHESTPAEELSSL